MRALTDRNQLFLEIDTARARVMESVAGLTDEQMDQPDLEGWSVKDHLTHITLWHEMRFFEISRIARLGHAGFPETDEAGIEDINQQFVANRRPLPVSQVLADLDFAREMVRQAVAASPEDRLDLRFYKELGPSGAGHDTDHAETIASWRKRMGI